MENRQVLAWQYDGVTTTCTAGWLTLRTESRLLRLRGKDQLDKYVQFVRIVGRMLKRSHHRLTLKIGADHYAVHLAAGVLHADVNGQPVATLQYGDLTDQAEWLDPNFPRRWTDGLSVNSAGLTGYNDEGTEMYFLPLATLTGFPELLRRGAAIAEGPPLPPLLTDSATIELHPRSGEHWSMLVVITAAYIHRPQLGKAALLRLADEIENAARGAK